jgi:DMSO/TMAO reductase YedYZ molybdopterin-dependent catalytic subunit
MISRRTLLAGGASAALALPVLARDMADLRLPGGPSLRPYEPGFAGKGKMIVQRVQPPLLETPFAVFDEGVLTPNESFYVRWHYPMPTRIDAADFRLAVRGAVKKPLSLALGEVVNSGAIVELAAVNQCAGNGRGQFVPRVPGAQWGPGAIGNAKWRGVRLRDLLDAAGVNADAKFVRFGGLDAPLVAEAPAYRKSIPIDVARRDDVMVAFAMNGEALPLLNGYPLRLVVPGWYATYWVKMLSDIEVLTREDDGFWMAKAYRMPTVPLTPGDKDFPTAPIGPMVPRAWITNHGDGDRIARGKPVELRGIAMGGDCGVAKVDVLVGNGIMAATLGPDEGAYSFRRWTLTLPEAAGRIGPRCTNVKAVTQPIEQGWNPNGYARGGVEFISLVPA